MKQEETTIRLVALTTPEMVEAWYRTKAEIETKQRRKRLSHAGAAAILGMAGALGMRSYPIGR